MITNIVYAEHCYFMFIFHCQMHIIMHCDCGHYSFISLYHCDTDKLLHRTLLFHVPVSSLHRYSITLDIVVSFSCVTGMQTHLSINMLVLCIVNTDMTFLLHEFTCIHALVVHIFLLH